MNLVNLNQFELSIRMNPVNPINKNETEFFRIIRIDSNRPDSFGLIQIDQIHSDWKFGLILIHSDWPDSFGLQVRIDPDWPDSFGLKVRINSDLFGLTKFIRIQSSDWNYPNHSGICIRTKQFHSDLIRS